MTNAIILNSYIDTLDIWLSIEESHKKQVQVLRTKP